MRRFNPNRVLIPSLLLTLAASSACLPNGPRETDPEFWKSYLDLRPESVDLRSEQTSLRNQGGRGTCITFAAIAALESAYKREGYGDLDLSEEMLNHVGKMGWLHPNWNDPNGPGGREGYMIGTLGAHYRENQVAAFSGGGGYGYVRIMVDGGLMAGLERNMPYSPADRGTEDFPELANAWYDPFWNLQLRANDYNLHPEVWPESAHSQREFYSVGIHAPIPPNSAEAIEAALTAGYEVVWDALLEGIQSPIWRTCEEAPFEGCGVWGAHSMLIVGYDRTDPDPKNHYFILKNSWGPTDVPGASGYTYVSYDYLRLGYSAGVILSVNPPRDWNELHLMGRWKIDSAGGALGEAGGFFDFYHMPGSFQVTFGLNGVEITDRRIGTYHSPDGRTFRVNGVMEGPETVRIHLDWSTPNLRWDRLSGETFVLRLAGDGHVLDGSIRLRRVTDPREFRALGAAHLDAFTRAGSN